ncbi:MAG: hypothetical protein RL215_2963, partial [Planctomycetota bacterium]
MVGTTKVGRTFLSVKKRGNRVFFAALEFAEAGELGLSWVCCLGGGCVGQKVGRTFLSVKKPAKRGIFVALEFAEAGELGLSWLCCLGGGCVWYFG